MKLASRINEFFAQERVRLMMFHRDWLSSTLKEKQEAMGKIIEDLNIRTLRDVYLGEVHREEAIQEINFLKGAIATEDKAMREKILNHLEVCYVEDILAILKLEM